MQFKGNHEQINNRFAEFWARENRDRPLVSVSAYSPRGESKPPQAPDTLLGKWFDEGYVVRASRYYIENTYFGGEAFPHIMPNLGPDLFGALLGCGLSFGNETSWAEHCVEDWKAFDGFSLNRENKYYKKIMSLTKSLCEDSKGDYFVAHTDIHPGVDAMVALRGPERLCMDLYDCFEDIRDIPLRLFPVFTEFYEELLNLTKECNGGGTSTWLNLFHPGKYYVPSCDFICMISPEMFREFVLPVIKAEVEYLDASIFHLDGPGALKHLDDILAIEKLGGVQWVHGEGNRLASEWTEVLQKIQAAGKVLDITIRPEEIKKLSETIRPEGVALHTMCGSKEEAKDLIAYTEKLFYRKKAY